MSIKEKNNDLKEAGIHISKSSGHGKDNYYYSNNSGWSYESRENAIIGEHSKLNEKNK